MAEARQAKAGEFEVKHRFSVILFDKVQVLQKNAQEKGDAGIDMRPLLWLQGESNTMRCSTSASHFRRLPSLTLEAPQFHGESEIPRGLPCPERSPLDTLGESFERSRSLVLKTNIAP